MPDGIVTDVPEVIVCCKAKFSGAAKVLAGNILDAIMQVPFQML
jgi:hypothetical protein